MKVRPEAEHAAHYSSKKVVILSCVYDSFSPAFTMSLAQTTALLLAHNVPYAFEYIQGHANTPRARNICVAKALGTYPEATDLVFIDSDIGWQPEQFFRLFPPLDPEPQIVAGIPRKRTAPDERVFAGYFLDPEKQSCGLFPGRAATAFIRIQRSVFDALRPISKPFYHESCDDGTSLEHLRAFFDYRVVKNEGLSQSRGEPTYTYEGEDYLFCRKALQKGITTWLDPSIELSHSHRVVLDGTVLQQMRKSNED